MFSLPSMLSRASAFAVLPFLDVVQWLAELTASHSQSLLMPACLFDFLAHVQVRT
jgi:hypothetical protein